MFLIKHKIIKIMNDDVLYQAQDNKDNKHPASPYNGSSPQTNLLPLIIYPGIHSFLLCFHCIGWYYCSYLPVPTKRYPSNAQRAFLFQSSYELISPLYHSDDSYWLKTLSMQGLITLIILIFIIIIIIIIIIDYQSTKDVEHAWTSFNERPPATQQVHTLHLQRSFDVNVNLWLFML